MASLEVSPVKIGFDFDHSAKVSDGSLIFFVFPVDTTQEIVGRGIIWIQVKNAVKVGDGPLILFEFPISPASPLIGKNSARIKFESMVKISNSLPVLF